MEYSNWTPQSPHDIASPAVSSSCSSPQQQVDALLALLHVQPHEYVALSPVEDMISCQQPITHTVTSNTISSEPISPQMYIDQLMCPFDYSLCQVVPGADQDFELYPDIDPVTDAHSGFSSPSTQYLDDSDIGSPSSDIISLQSPWSPAVSDGFPTELLLPPQSLQLQQQPLTPPATPSITKPKKQRASESTNAADNVPTTTATKRRKACPWDARLHTISAPKKPKKHVPVKKSHKCTEPGCNKIFTRAFNLRSHLNTHTNARPFQCEYCHWSFTRRHDLDRHRKSKHMDAKPFECAGCLTTFGRSDALKRHLRVEPQCLSIMGGVFSGNDLVIRNELIAGGGKPAVIF